MEPQIYTDTHRFLNRIRNDFSLKSYFAEFLDLSVLICVYLCKSVAKNSSLFRAFFVSVRG